MHLGSRCIFSLLAILLLTKIFAAELPNSHGDFELQQVVYSQVPGWGQDRHLAALTSFRYSCRQILKGKPSLPLDSKSQLKTLNQAWQNACHAAINLDDPTDGKAKQFFERWFEPYAVIYNNKTTGLFTGYYLPSYPGSLHKTPEYPIPLYTKPRTNSRKYSRQEINEGVFSDQGLEILWLRNKVDRFFLQIQGSGNIQLSDGSAVHVSFAGKNHFPYTAIGRTLIEQGEISKKDISMHSIREWLFDHPEQIDKLLNQNQSFIYFNMSDDTDTIGAQQVPLTAQRSLAVDRNYIPLGAPVFIDTTVTKNNQLLPFQQLLIAQDTGSAIKGPIRGDIFWGSGIEAEHIASSLQSPGRSWLLLPKAPSTKE